MKKLVMSLDLEDDKAKQKAMRTVSTLQGIDLIAVDMKGKKMMVIGTVDPVHVVSKLRKYWQVDIVTVGPAKEPEKKEEVKPAAEEGKKEEGKGEGKKEEGKKEDGGGGKKEEGAGKKDEAEAPKKLPMPQPMPEHLLELIKARQYNPYMGNYPPYMAMANPYMNHPQMPQPSYHVQSVEEDNPNGNGCSIF